MKKLICLLLALALAAALFACGSPEPSIDSQDNLSSSTPPETDPPADSTEPPSSSESTTEPSEDPTELPDEPPARVSVENQVDYTPDGDVTANVVDAVNTEFTDMNGIACVCILPKIELPGPNIEAINAEILADYSGYIISDQSRTFEYQKIHYKWAVKGDILSVVVMPEGSIYAGGEEGYGYQAAPSVYNISISKCRLISNEEVYAASGIADVQTRVLHAAASHAAKWLASPERSAVVTEDNKPWIVDLFTQDISQENFDRAIPYFNEAGQLCALTYVHAPGGSGYFWGDFCVEDYNTEQLLTAEEYYDICS